MNPGCPAARRRAGRGAGSTLLSLRPRAGAFGYDRYPRALPHRQTIGESLGANDFAETLPVLLVGYGYQEVMSLTIASSKDAFDTSDRVVIRNPLNEELTTLRSSMLPA